MQNNINKRASLVALLFLTISCQNLENQTKKEYDKQSDVKQIELPVDENAYPDFIIENKLQKVYDDAKWNLYLYASIDTPRDINGRLAFQNSKTYAAYPLVFDTLYQNADTLICYFNFYIGDSVLSEERIFDLHLADVPNAVNVYDKNRCVYFKGKIGFDYTYTCAELDPLKVPKDKSEVDTNYLKSTPGRLFFPTSDLVVEYINAHQKELNPWFINEAKKRGVIK